MCAGERAMDGQTSRMDKKMKRVLFITTKPGVPWKGVSHRTRYTLGALLAAGYTVEVLGVPRDAPLSHPGIVVHYAPRIPFCGNLPEGPSFRRFILDVCLLFKALALMGRGRYEILHGLDDSGVLAYLISRVYRVPYVVDRQTDFTAGGGDSVSLWGWFYRRFERRALCKADAVIGNSDEVVPLLAAHGRRSRACVIPDIPSLDFHLADADLAAARAAFKPAEGMPLITCVASAYRFRGLDLFLNAMPAVLKELPMSRFAVVGGTQTEIDRARAALQKAGIDGAIHFTGRIQPEKLAALLKVSDVLVATRGDGTTPPIKVLDYLAAERPVVAVDSPANRSVLTPDNALIVPPTPGDLAAGILHICRNQGVAIRLATAAAATVRQEKRTEKTFRDAIRNCYAYVLSR